MSSTAEPQDSVATIAKKPKKGAGLGIGPRLAAAIFFAVIIGSIALSWNAKIMPGMDLTVAAPWWGNYIIIPLMATGISFAFNSILQKLSCDNVDFNGQAANIPSVILPILFMTFLVEWIPKGTEPPYRMDTSYIRWPIVGLMPAQTEDVKRGLSSAFYMFWTALYVQLLTGGFSQICPK